MVFYIPTDHVCPKCETKVAHSRSVAGSVFTDEEGRPFCPVCLAEFLKQHVPLMENTRVRSERY